MVPHLPISFFRSVKACAARSDAMPSLDPAGISDRRLVMRCSGQPAARANRDGFRRRIDQPLSVRAACSNPSWCRRSPGGPSCQLCAFPASQSHCAARARVGKMSALSRNLCFAFFSHPAMPQSRLGFWQCAWVVWWVAPCIVPVLAFQPTFALWRARSVAGRARNPCFNRILPCLWFSHVSGRRKYSTPFPLLRWL